MAKVTEKLSDRDWYRYEGTTSSGSKIRCSFCKASVSLKTLLKDTRPDRGDLCMLPCDGCTAVTCRECYDDIFDHRSNFAFCTGRGKSCPRKVCGICLDSQELMIECHQCARQMCKDCNVLHREDKKKGSSEEANEKDNKKNSCSFMEKCSACKYYFCRRGCIPNKLAGCTVSSRMIEETGAYTCRVCFNKSRGWSKVRVPKKKDKKCDRGLRITDTRGGYLRTVELDLGRRATRKMALAKLRRQELKTLQQKRMNDQITDSAVDTSGKVTDIAMDGSKDVDS
jgi:hypothetical protein